jgi:hypothetical protein
MIEHVTVPDFPDRSRKSSPNSVGAGVGTGAVRGSPALLGASADFRSLDRICNGIHLNFGIKYYRMHEKIRAGSEEARAGAVKDRPQPGGSRSRSCKDRSQIYRSRSRIRLWLRYRDRDMLYFVKGFSLSLSLSNSLYRKG